MTIKATYSSYDEIPAAYVDLYEERGRTDNSPGVYHLAKIDGIKTEADVLRVQRALESEKASKAALKQQWDNFFGERKPEDVLQMLDKYPELEALANGKVDEEKINSLVEGRIKSKVSPIEREKELLKKKLMETEERVNLYEKKEKTRRIHDLVRQASVKLKVLDTAQEDALMLAEHVFEVAEDGSVVARDGFGTTPGIPPEVWLTEMQQKRPHWWPASFGGGARGSGGDHGFSTNPWSDKHWNLTEQARIYRSPGGPAKAEQLARSAGTVIGGQRPNNKQS